MSIQATSGPWSDESKYAWYVTALLMVACMFSFLDRYILNLMVGPIKRDLGISDHEFALLAGPAFGLFYTVMALPLGWLADRYSRRWIISIGVSLWSLMTAACGLAGTFLHLFVVRMGVGIGEATLSPSTYSLLPDYFDKSRLPRAMSLYSIGVFMGAGLALVIGGVVVSAVESHGPVVLPLIGSVRPWQLVFILVGLPGGLVALLIAVSVKEPVRRGLTEAAAFDDLFRFIASHPRMFLAFFLGAGCYSMMGSMDTWYPELFIRTCGWSAAQAGRINGISSLTAGPAGLVFAGWYSTRLMAKGKSDACLRITAYASIGLGLSAVLMPLMPNSLLMTLFLFPYKFFVGFPLVLVTSAIQMVAPSRLRGQLGALFLLCLGVIAISGGPLFPALITDFVFRDDAKLGYSLAAAAGIVSPLAFMLLWGGLAEFRRTLNAATREEAAGQ